MRPNLLVLVLVAAGLALAAGRAAAVDYLIDVQSGGPGKVTPSPNVIVPAGGNQTFTFAPDVGNVADVTVDDVHVGSGLTDYTFTNVQSDHVLYVSFGPAPPPPPPPPPPIDTTLLSTNGPVYAAVSDGNRIYV